MTKGTLPLPDDYINIKADGEVIGYQGYAGTNVLETIGYSRGGKDPQNNTYFTYYLTANKKYYQIMGFLEDENVQAYKQNIFPVAHANIDYSNRFPGLSEIKLGVLTDLNNTPLQELSFPNNEMLLANTHSGTTYRVHLTDTINHERTGIEILGPLRTVSKNGARFGQASYECPEGFILVPGNPQFMQTSFCVAKYEMSWHGMTGIKYGNFYSYVDHGDLGRIISEAGNSAIVEITIAEAMAECNEMGTGYHLITNNEWMTIARNIEAQWQNWSSGTVGTGYIYNGRSNDSPIGCTRILASNIPDGTRGGSTTGHDNCDGKNKHTLSNGEEIWDLSGNVREYVNKANTEDNTYYDSGRTVISETGQAWTRGTDGTYLISDMDRYGSKNYLGKPHGMGNVAYGGGTDNNIFVRGGSARHDSNNGIFNIRLNWNNTNKDWYTGFRCAK